MTDADTIENRTYDEIALGDAVSLDRTLTEDDIAVFAALSGDATPVATDEDAARAGVQSRVIGHGMWAGTLLATVLGTLLPGPGTCLAGEALRFAAPIGPGDRVTLTVRAREKRPDTRTVVFECTGVNQFGETVLSGTAEVVAPPEKIRRPRRALPEVQILHRRDGYTKLLEHCRELAPMPTAVAHPCDDSALTAAVEAAHAGLIAPVLVGPAAKIRAVAERCALDIAAFPLIDAEHSHDAATRAVELVRAGEAEALMKGSLHTDELMEAVVAKATGLRTGRRLSHAFVMDVPNYHKILVVTDAAINIQPTLEDKRDICQNAIDLLHAFGLKVPKVAILSAVETVTGRIPTTLDAAALCKMADRGQITGAVLDGPLAFDNAISREAARIKGIRSEVAGDPDILLVPDLEAGNILAKQLTFLGRAEAAGIVLGARVPVILTSRADAQRTKLASCAVAAILAHHRRSVSAGAITGAQP